MTPDQLAERLRDRFRLLVGGSRSAPARQQTLRATVDWSYELLEEPERRLFGRLATFAGGFSMAAAESVCGWDLEANEIAELLRRLVVKSLVVVDFANGAEPRYSLLETLREYAQERLVLSGEAQATRDAHAAYYVKLAEQVDPPGGTPKFRGPDARKWFERLELEHDNLRTALGWLVDCGDAEAALRLAGALRAFWNQRGHPGEGRVWLARALALPDSQNTAARAHALVAAGTLACRQGDLDSATSVLDDAAVICRRLELRAELVYALYRRGWVAKARGEFAETRRLSTEALLLSREIRQPALTALCLCGLGWACWEQGALVEARAAAEEGLVLATHAGWAVGIGLLQSLLGVLSSEAGDLVTAQALLDAGLELRRSGGYLGEDLFQNLGHLGWIVLQQGDRIKARAAFVESVLFQNDMGDQAWLAESLEGCACVEVADHRPLQGLRLAAAAAHLRSIVGAQSAPRARRIVEHWLAQARRSLGRTASEAAWAAGTSMAIEEAIAVALTPRSTPRAAPLTKREYEVVKLVTSGRSDRQIGATLVISERTVHAHVRNILAKLGLGNRVQIAAWVQNDETRIGQDNQPYF
jgi:DNA-binding CsgD family transcriptional regulator/tetratricopeptide (TPR) repeat protein